MCECDVRLSQEMKMPEMRVLIKFPVNDDLLAKIGGLNGKEVSKNDGKIGNVH